MLILFVVEMLSIFKIAHNYSYCQYRSCLACPVTFFVQCAQPTQNWVNIERLTCASKVVEDSGTVAEADAFAALPVDLKQQSLTALSPLCKSGW